MAQSKTKKDGGNFGIDKDERNGGGDWLFLGLVPDPWEQRLSTDDIRRLMDHVASGQKDKWYVTARPSRELLENHWAFETYGEAVLKFDEFPDGSGVCLWLSTRWGQGVVFRNKSFTTIKYKK